MCKLCDKLDFLMESLHMLTPLPEWKDTLLTARRASAEPGDGPIDDDYYNDSELRLILIAGIFSHYCVKYRIPIHLAIAAAGQSYTHALTEEFHSRDSRDKPHIRSKPDKDANKDEDF